MEIGEQVIIKELNIGCRYGNVVYTEYHSPFANHYAIISGKTCKGNYYLTLLDGNKIKVVFSSEMLIPGEEFGMFTKDKLSNNLNKCQNGECKDQLQGEETSRCIGSKRNGSEIHGRGNGIAISLGRLSYHAQNFRN